MADEKLTVGQLIAFLQKHDKALFIQNDFDTANLNIRGKDYKGESMDDAIGTICLPSEYEYRPEVNCSHPKGLVYTDAGGGCERLACPDCGADQATVEAA